jgi:hypothetical protein
VLNGSHSVRRGWRCTTDKQWQGKDGNWHQQWWVAIAGVNIWRWQWTKLGVGVWWWQWTAAVVAVDNWDGVQWQWWWWHLMAEAVFEGVWWYQWWTTARRW